ncbi:E3 ubiquitin-protein ligase TRIM39-like [Lissotriton helveticus]
MAASAPAAPGAQQPSASLCTGPDPAAALGDDASCVICLEYFTDPVTIECGHTFCRSCLSRYMKQQDLTISCPRCRHRFGQSGLRPNTELSAVAQAFRQIRMEASARPQRSCCEGHSQVKRSSVCPVCWEPQNDQCHNGGSEEDGSEEYKPHLLKCLAALQAALEEVLKEKVQQEERDGCCRTQFRRQRLRIELEFEGLQRFLKEEEQFLLSRLQLEEEKTLKTIQCNVAKLEERSSRLRKLIQEIEENYRQLGGDLLQASRTLLNRCKVVDVQKTEAEYLEPEKEIHHFHQQHMDLQKAVADFKEWRWARRHAVDVTLAPETAHPYLILSEDWKSVRDGDTKQDLPPTNDRFDHYTVVLGCERFSSGRHYWEVEVGHKSDWGVGVCSELARRKGRIILLPEAGYWIVRLRDGDNYSALTSSTTQINPKPVPRAVGVFLDYEAGKVSFYNAENKSHLYTFHDTFTQVLRPLFSPGVVDKGKNSGALRIRMVTSW